MITPVIVDIMGQVIDTVRANSFDLTFNETFSGPGAPFYMYGHRREIANTLLQMDEDSVNKYRKYPLFALRMDIAEEVEDGMVEYNMNIAILDYTKPEYSAAERYEHVFKPFLYPLYELFMDALKIHKFYWKGDYPPHTKIDRPFWGVTENVQRGVSNGNDGYIFNDPLDAIEIVNLRVKRLLVCEI